MKGMQYVKCLKGEGASRWEVARAVARGWMMHAHMSPRPRLARDALFAHSASHRRVEKICLALHADYVLQQLQASPFVDLPTCV